ncbi:MAG TPA: plasmid stabilization protein [Acetobacteraceae bacterium]|nr:plasmid stabilization protein [Acetobacteraceae bacterium]
MKVVLSDAARLGLERIGDYIARDNPSRAGSFVAELRTACLTLGEMPQAFPLVPRYERLGIRRRPHGNYLIFYRVDQDRVSIVQILHGARDYEALLFPDL